MWTPGRWMNLLLFVQSTPEWMSMHAEKEGTSWHREESVAVHTLMTMSHYLQLDIQRTERERMHTLMALLFHDFAKPSSRTTSTAGNNQYTGHEARSSVMMFDFFLKYEKPWRWCVEMGYTSVDLVKIGWLIDHHLPYAVKKESKRYRMKQEMLKHFGEGHAFYDMLRSDCAGRISDVHATKLQNLENWINDFQAIVIVPEEELLRIRAERKAAWFAKHGLVD